MSTVAQIQTAAPVAIPNAGAVNTRRRLHISARLRCTWTKVRYNKWAQHLAIWTTAGAIAVFYGWLAASGF
jgi:hypothetical protein